MTLLALLLALSPSVGRYAFVYRACFTSAPEKADVAVTTVKDRKAAQFCVWDTRDCETAEMIVHEVKDASGYTVYLSYSRDACR